MPRSRWPVRARFSAQKLIPDLRDFFSLFGFTGVPDSHRDDSHKECKDEKGIIKFHSGGDPDSHREVDAGLKILLVIVKIRAH